MMNGSGKGQKKWPFDAAISMSDEIVAVTRGIKEE
jgi:hypothetical protein